MALYLAAPLIAAYFAEPRLVDIVRWLSLATVITAMTAPATSLLSRRLDFRWINIVQVTSYAVGYLAIGVPLAVQGFGVWSLVAAWLSQAVTCFLLSILRSPYPWKPLLWYPRAPIIWKYGLTVFATNLCNGILTNLDRIFISKTGEARQVGIYSAAYNLADAPNGVLVSSLQPVFFAAGAQIQSEPERLRRAYLSLLATVWILIGPLFVILSILANRIVAVLYGAGWEQSGQVLAVLALGMPAYITWALSTPVLWNTNRRHLECLLQLPIILITMAALYLTSSAGVLAVAGTVAATQVLRAAVIATAACRRLAITPRDLFVPALRALALCSVGAVGCYGALLLCKSINMSNIGSVLIGGLGGVGLLAIAGFAFPILLGPAVTDALTRFRLRLPLPKKAA